MAHLFYMIAFLNTKLLMKKKIMKL